MARGFLQEKPGHARRNLYALLYISKSCIWLLFTPNSLVFDTALRITPPCSRRLEFLATAYQYFFKFVCKLVSSLVYTSFRLLFFLQVLKAQDVPMLKSIKAFSRFTLKHAFCIHLATLRVCILNTCSLHVFKYSTFL